MAYDDQENESPLPESFKPQGYAKKNKAGALTLIEDDFKASAEALMRGEITDKELLENTIQEATDAGWTVAPVGDPQNPSQLSLTKPGQSPRELPIHGALSRIYTIIQSKISQQAGEQPEIGSAKQRAIAGMKSSPMGAVNYIQGQFPGARVFPGVDENGNMTGEIIIQEPGQPPRMLDRKDVTNLKDVLDVSGDVIPAITTGAGALLGAAATRSAQGGVAGAGIGGAAGEAAQQLISSALPGSDELSTPERAARVGISAAIGAGAQAAMIPIAAGARMLPRAAQTAWGALPEALPGVAKARAATATRSAAESIASPAGELGFSKQMQSFLARTKEIEQNLSKYSSEGKVWFTGPEATGSREGLAIQRTLSQNTGMVNEMALARENRLKAIASAADGLVDEIASRPELLGRSSVGQTVAKTINEYTRGLAKARSEAAGPIYKAAAEAGAGKRIIPTDATQQALQEAVDATRLNPKAGVGAGSLLESLKSMQSAGGRISIDDMQRLRSFFGSIANGDQTVIEGLSTAAHRRLARNILRGIDADLKTSANSITGEASQLLQRANSTWSELSKPIDDVATSTVNRMLKLSSKGQNESITPLIYKMSSSERSGLFKILDESSPEVAANLRAQLLVDLYEKGGKQSAVSQFGRQLMSEVSKAPIEPGRLSNVLVKNGDYLGELFGNNPRAKKAILDLSGALDRVAKTPGWGDSGTAANLVQQLAARFGSSASLSKAAADAAKKVIEKRMMDPREMLRAMSTPEGAARLTEVIKTLGQPTNSITRVQMRSLITSINTLALELGEGGADQRPMVIESTPAKDNEWAKQYVGSEQ